MSFEEEPVREAIPAQFATLAGNNMNMGRMAVGKEIDLKVFAEVPKNFLYFSTTCSRTIQVFF